MRGLASSMAVAAALLGASSAASKTSDYTPKMKPLRGYRGPTLRLHDRVDQLIAAQARFTPGMANASKIVHTKKARRRIELAKRRALSAP